MSRLGVVTTQRLENAGQREIVSGGRRTPHPVDGSSTARRNRIDHITKWVCAQDCVQNDRARNAHVGGRPQCHAAVFARSRLRSGAGAVLPTATPPTAADYTKAGLPWFDYYGGDAKALEETSVLANLKSVMKLGGQKGQTPLPENESVDVERIIALRKKGSQEVREAAF